MDSTIQYTDLFDADFVTRINEVATALQGMNGEIKNIASSVLGSISSISNTTTALSALTAQVNALQQAQQQVQQAQQATSKVMSGMAALTDTERQAIESLKTSLNTMVNINSMQLNSIDTQKKSYNELKASLNAITEALNRMNKEQRESTAAGQSMIEEAQKIKTALQVMDNEYKKATQSVKNLSDVQRRFPKLQQFEVANVEAFAKSIETLRQDLSQSLPAIDMQQASYNQLYATYNVLKDALDQMTPAQRESTAAGQTMTKQAHDLMEQLNKLQQATGKYTLNVGNYASAFDGFGYSIQQVLREIPSATTLNQFFLAISNNIPMVADQIRKFTMEQTELHRKANEAMQAGNKEAADAIAAQYQSLGKKIVSSIWNVQSAILIVLLVLKNYGSDLWHWFVGLFKEVFEITQKIKDSMEKIRFSIQVRKDIAEVRTELNLLLKKMDETNKGTDEWRNIVLRINELTKGNLDYIKDTPEEVRKVTKAYMEQAKQIAINRRVVDKLAESEVAATTKRGVEQTLGAEIQRRYSVYSRTGEIAKLDAKAFGELAAALEISDDKLDEFQKKLEIYTRPGMQAKNVKQYGKAVQYINDLIGSQFTTLSEHMKDYYEELLKPLPETEDKGRAKSTKERIQLMSDLWEEYMQNRYKLQQDEFKREQEAENDRYELQLVGLEKEYRERAKNYKEQIKDKQALEDTLAELGKQYDALVEIAEQEHYDNLMKIEDDFTAREIKAAQEAEEQKLKIWEDAAEKELKIRKKRIKNAKDEIYNNAIVTQNVQTYINLVKRLEKELAEVTIPDEGETQRKIQEQIKKYNELIDKELANYATSQQTKKIGSIWDILGGGISFSKGFKEGVLKSMGIDTALIKDEEMIDGLFQNWLDSAESAFGNWADKMRDTLSGLLDAYVEFYKARAEAAAEDTDAAKEEYEKQKALLEAGYASSIETEWTQYQEKKRIQKQAERDAAEWSERQRQLNQLETVASLGTTVANLYKSMSTAGIAGIAAATAASAALLTMFATTQSQIAGTVKYGEGHVEMISGGSHASGHDSPLAFDSKGRQRRVEGGEIFAVINNPAVRKYGADNIIDIINGINARNLESGVDGVKVAMFGMDLGRIERSLDTIVGNGRNTTTVDAQGNIIVRRGNFTKKITYTRN